MTKRTRQPGINESDGEDGIAKTPNSRSSMRSTPKKAAKVAKQITTPVKMKRKIIVAVDYGTTYSGVAYVSTRGSDARDVEVITDWPGASDKLEKVPSRIAYKSENPHLDEDKMGYEVDASMKSYSWTKLLLDGDATAGAFDVKSSDDELGQVMLVLPPNKSAEEVATDFLSNLYNRTMERLAQTQGPVILKITPIEFWFTVPATWQDSSVVKTRNAAINAGFGSRKGDELNFITEPESAALAILSQKVEQNPELYKAKSNVLIADLGGGTLDFQCLTLESLDPLKTEEAIAGNGGKSGSTYIDREFHGWLVNKFGDAFEQLPSSKTAPGSRFMEIWEAQKKAFNGKDLRRIHRVHLPALGRALRDRNLAPSSYDFEDHEVLVSGQDIAGMFQPSLKIAVSLLKEQVNALKKEKKNPLQVVVLCGGLGSSEYVLNYFKQHGKKICGSGVQLVSDERAWSAVVRGAAIRGLGGNFVLSKRAKRFYGIGIHRAFRDGIDKDEDEVFCPIEGRRAEGYIDWVVKRGQKFSANFRAQSNVYVALDHHADEEDLQLIWKLYSCGAEVAEDRIDASGVEQQGKIKLDLSRCQKRQKIEQFLERPHEKINVRIVLKLGNEKGILVVEALHNRTVVGTARIDYGKHRGPRPAQSAGSL